MATSLRALLAGAVGPADVRWVSSVAEAVHFIRYYDVASVLLSLDSADGCGLDALERILTVKPAMAVVVLVAHDDEELGVQALSAGAYDYLLKGEVTADLLVRALRHATERAQAVHAAARLAAIVDASMDAVFSWSLDGTIRSWNPAAERVFGYAAGDIVGRNFSLLAPPDRRVQMHGILLRIGAGERLERFETRRVRRDGSEFDVALQITPLVENGAVSGGCTIARDVSSYKRAEAELRESGDRLAEAQRLAHVGSWSLDTVSRTLTWSDELYRLLGYEPGAFEPDVARLFDRLHPDDADRMRAAIQAQVSVPKPWESEYRIVLPGGAVRWLAARTEPVLGKSGDVVGVHGTNQDITGRKLADEQLRFQAHVLAAVGEAVIATDPKGDVTYWGPGAETLYGWSALEAVGRNIVEVTPTTSTADDAVRIMSALARGDRWTGLVELGRRDGSTFTAEVTDTPVFDDAGELVAVIGISADVSLREEANAGLTRARDQALEASVLKSHFLANMSHEIRTPMNGVLGMTELLLGTDLDPRQREYAETVRTSGAALLDIINDILDLSKIEADRLELEAIDFDLATVVEDVAELFAGPAQAKGLELVVSIGPDVATVRGDRGRVRQILTNLVGNAVKFTSAGRVVVAVAMIGTTPEGATVRFQVDDTGIGIEPDKASRIFEPFAQADSSTTREYGGTGLGLAITRELVELMGGRCGIDAHRATGSSFWCTVTLPPASGVVAGRVGDAVDLRGARALVVDDDVANRAVVESYLAGWGMQVEVAGSGRGALDSAQVAATAKMPFAIAVIDVHMPDMDGWELATALAGCEATRGMPLVLLTSSGDTRAIGINREDGVVALLPKPVRRDRLRLCVAGIVAGVASSAAPTAAPANQVRPTVAVRGSVLLAEDNVINQKVAMAMLTSGGYEVDLAVDGAEAVRAVHARRYDVVLMDCQMPQMDGYEAAAAIRAGEVAGRRVPIVALTASAMQEDRDRCLAAGMDDYLAKPVKRAEVLAAVGRWANPA